MGNMEDRKLFLKLMRKMLQWEPEKRSRAKDLAEDEWITRHTERSCSYFDMADTAVR